MMLLCHGKNIVYIGLSKCRVKILMRLCFWCKQPTFSPGGEALMEACLKCSSLFFCMFLCVCLWLCYAYACGNVKDI